MFIHNKSWPYWSSTIIANDTENAWVVEFTNGRQYSDCLTKGAPIYCEFTVEGSKKMCRGAAKLFPAPANKDFTAGNYSAASDTVAIVTQ